jgi:hypothetical protein
LQNGTVHGAINLAFGMWVGVHEQHARARKPASASHGRQIESPPSQAPQKWGLSLITSPVVPGLNTGWP